MEKLGMTLVRTLHQAWPDPSRGAERGEVEYELLNTDWERQEAEAAPHDRASWPEKMAFRPRPE